MKNAQFLSALILLTTLSACSRKLSEEDYNAYLAKVTAAYCTNDIRSAEKSIREDLLVRSQWESNHVGGVAFRLDYAAGRAADHECLFMIYRKMGNEQEMKHEYQLAVENLIVSSRRWGTTLETNLGYDEFARRIAKMQRRLNIRWQTNYP